MLRLAGQRVESAHWQDYKLTRLQCSQPKALFIHIWTTSQSHLTLSSFLLMNLFWLFLETTNWDSDTTWTIRTGVHELGAKSLTRFNHRLQFIHAAQSPASSSQRYNRANKRTKKTRAEDCWITATMAQRYFGSKPQ